MGTQHINRSDNRNVSQVNKDIIEYLSHKYDVSEHVVEEGIAACKEDRTLIDAYLAERTGRGRGTDFRKRAGLPE